MEINKEYIELIDGRSLRVVLTLAVLQEINSTIGLSKLTAIQNGQIAFDSITEVFLIMIKHGERLENRDLTISGVELKHLLQVDQMYKMVEIINRDSKGFTSKSAQFRSQYTKERFN